MAALLLAVGGACLGLLLAACSSDGAADADSSPPADPVGRVAELSSPSALGEVIELCLRIADEPEERRVGLMDVDTLAPFDGMLFMFPTAEPHRFWMQNTRIPLDLVPIRDAELTDPIPMEPCPPDTENCPTYGPDFPYSRAIELDQGRLDALGLVPTRTRPVGFALTERNCRGSGGT